MNRSFNLPPGCNLSEIDGGYGRGSTYNEDMESNTPRQKTPMWQHTIKYWGKDGELAQTILFSPKSFASYAQIVDHLAIVEPGRIFTQKDIIGTTSEGNEDN